MLSYPGGGGVFTLATGRGVPTLAGGGSVPWGTPPPGVNRLKTLPSPILRMRSVKITCQKEKQVKQMSLVNILNIRSLICEGATHNRRFIDPVQCVELFTLQSVNTCSQLLSGAFRPREILGSN